MSHQQIALRLFLVYGLLIAISIVGSFLFLQNTGNSFSLAALFVSAIATSTLTHGVLTINFIPSIPHIVFIILMHQAIGLLFNATLFWQCRQIFGEASEKRTGFGDAFTTTIWITLISQILLIMFFLYSIPVSEIPEGRKIWAAIAVASGAFHLSGIPFYNSFFTNTFLEQNFIFQIGIAGGITLGNLGIFVIHELFSIKRLRQRLADTSIDWTFITKVGVFIGGVAIITSSLLYWLMEKDRLLSGKNITESAIAAVYEVSSVRGFGVSIFDEGKTEPLTSVVSMALAGPFSNGGGLTLLIFVALAFIFKSGRTLSEIKIAGRLLSIIIAISGISLLLATLGYLTGSNELAPMISAFTGNSVIVSPDITLHSGVWLSWLMLTGKLAPVVAAFWIIGFTGKSNP
jgi:hypothetical protein